MAPQSHELAALAHLVRGAVKPPSAAELAQGLMALRTLTAPRPRSAGAGVGLAWAFVTALAVASLVLWLARSHFRSHSSLSEGPMTVNAIQGGEVLPGGYLSETGSSGIELSFSDGSNFDLESGSRARLHVVSTERASLSLERGTVACRVGEDSEHHWSVAAGPFVVEGRGTDFTVAWNPAHEHLEVRSRRGRVAVSGSVVEGELLLKPDQTLTVSLPRRETVIREGSRI